MKAPKCKLCKANHWLSESHALPIGRVRVAAVDATKVALIEIGINVTDVTKTALGRPRRYGTNAERQKAYRARKAG